MFPQVQPRIAYREVYHKYRFAETYRVETGIKLVEPISDTWISLDINGLLTLWAGFGYDGPSGPALDTKSAMRGAAGHDGLYKLMRLGLLDSKWRPVADKLYRKWCLEDGMWRIRAWYHFRAVDWFAAGAAKESARRRIIYAPW